MVWSYVFWHYSSFSKRLKYVCLLYVSSEKEPPVPFDVLEMFTILPCYLLQITDVCPSKCIGLKVTDTFATKLPC